MTEQSIFKTEQSILQKAEAIVNDKELKDSPLYEDYHELCLNYKKLFLQFEHIVKISDLQQKQLRNSQEIIADYNKDLQQLNSSKDKFFSIISHDLKSPINSFLGFINLLASNIDVYSKEEIHSMALEIKQYADNLFKLIENLLDWARIQMKRVEFQPQKYLLQTLVVPNVEFSYSSASMKKIQITNLVSDNIYVFVDKNMLNTILRNLLSNAIKFTHENGEITITSEDFAENVEISISDTGVGMTEKEIKNLFRIDVSRSKLGTAKEGGTGLGLILCKEMIEKNNGEIWVKSTPGEGSRFTFSLPRAFSLDM